MRARGARKGLIGIEDDASTRSGPARLVSNWYCTPPDATGGLPDHGEAENTKTVPIDAGAHGLK